MSNIEGGNVWKFLAFLNPSAFEDKIQGVLRGVILKHSNRKDAEKIKLNKKKLKNIDHKKIGFSSGTKVFINENLCGYYKLPWSKCKKLLIYYFSRL